MTKPLAPWYVTGLIDGCGVLTYQSNPKTKQLVVVFALRTSRHREIIARLQSFFGGAGKIYGRAGSLLRIVRPTELARVVRHLDDFPLQGAKAGRYAIWREMVLLRAAYYRAAAPEELLRLARRLSDQRESEAS